MTLDRVRNATRETPTLQKDMQAIQTVMWWGDPDPVPFNRFKDEMSIYDGVILRDHSLFIPFLCMNELSL